MVAVAALLLAAAQASCPVQLVRFEVRGESMRGLLAPGSELAAELGYYACHPVRRGDLAIVRLPWRKRPIVKRVLALPGDRIALRAGPAGVRLLVNGRPLTTPGGAPYAFRGGRERMLRLYVEQFGGALPPGTFFVFGTERGGSLDSSRFGPVLRSELAGRVRRRATAGRAQGQGGP